MATLNDVRRFALALPETSERESHGNRAWTVKSKGFVWERPLRRGDLAALGERAPAGPILGVRTADLEMKEALLASDSAVFFTTPHFTGYAAVLVPLDAITIPKLRRVVIDAWLACAPPRLAALYLAAPGRRPR